MNPSPETDDLPDVFACCRAVMTQHGFTRFDDVLRLRGVPPFHGLEQRVAEGRIAPVDLLVAAARVGLVPKRQPPPELAGSARGLDVLWHLEARDHELRFAQESDLPALVELDTRCWAPALRTDASVLLRRIQRDPRGQIVLQRDGAVVGAIYSQPIPTAEALCGVTVDEVDALFAPGSDTVQLLAINVLPEMQHRRLGDDLLEFMLIYRSLEPHVRSVVAVTRCKNFHEKSGISLADYIHACNAHGALADPILRFHELHGATIEKLVPGYRPADTDNGGCGVLVHYDIRRRVRKDPKIDGTACGGGTEAREEIRLAILERLGLERQSAFSYDRPLMEMGLDSADLLALSETLSQRFGIALPPTFFFLHNTPAKVVDHLGGRASPWDSPVTRQPAATRDDIAIVGFACRLPGRIDTPEAFWRLLEAGDCAIGTLPEDRWRWSEGIDPKGADAGIDRGGFLDSVDAFDAPFFRVSPVEAQSMDPQQRILLELCWQAIEHAGYAPSRLAGRTIGVFIGASGSDYARLLEQSGAPIEAHYGAGASVAMLANRISYVFDLCGPSLVVDTACSSSLVAVHEAVRSLRAGECAEALVGGINVILHPANSIAYRKAGMLSKDGRCRTFDAAANGYVRSEGAAVLLLKPVEAALASGDHVYALVRGSACSHGGQAGGLTVPHPGGQARLLQAAWKAAGIDPQSLSYIEAHGTGTALGDPIEVQGLRLAFAEAGGEPAPGCGLGSVKTNLGHLEAAAGLVGLLKVVLCLQHEKLPASLHFRGLNPQIALDKSRLYIVDRLQPWKTGDGAPRMAGVSSFGSGGTNAHVIVSEYRAPEPVHGGDDGPVLFVLSARTPSRLVGYARLFVEWLASEAGRAVALRDLARQMQTGRDAMEARLALVVADRDELIAGLTRFAACGNAPEVVAGAEHLLRLAALWRAGEEVDWSRLYDTGPVRRVALPTYPFERNRYWVPAANSDDLPEPPQSSDAAPLKPVLLAPVWRPFAGKPPVAPPGQRLLVIGAHTEHFAAIREVYADAQALELDTAASIEVLVETLRGFGMLDHVVWIAPPAEDASLVEAQRGGLLAFFKLLKALLALSYGEKSLAVTAITFRTQAIPGDAAPAPAHAGVHGFAGVLAKELPRWSVRALDLEDEQQVLGAVLKPPPSAADGETLALRAGQWLRRVFVPAELREALPPYRQNGVYVVIGGAGGIGEAWTRHVVEYYRAQVIWIGRRPLDTAISERIARIAALGPAPYYISADASDRVALRAALAKIRQDWPDLHGVVHAAVGAFDRSIAETDEARFRDILSVKIDASVHLVEEMRGVPLDFLLFFSSVVALEKNGGLAGYAAGGAFEDALALALARSEGPCVKVVDWGHWEIGAGAVISRETKLRNARGGRPPLQPAEAMAALETLLCSPLPQLCVLRSARLEALPFVDAGRRLHIDPEPASRYIDRLPPASPLLRAQARDLTPLSLFANAGLEAHLAPLFAGVLRAFRDRVGTESAVGGFYRQWLAASRDFLAAQEPGDDLATCWRRWEAAKLADLSAPDLGSAIDLAEACLRALPDILSGVTRATDILFPGASMRRVEGIYRDNAVADHFNRSLAEQVAAAIELHRRQEPNARLRILEIGAGTGGTTAMVLPLVAPHREVVEEYAYTDVSKAFLFHAEEQFVPTYDFVRTRLYDVEKPLTGQGLAPASYDIVIATNVLHATRDIRATLGHVKALLRGNGLLFLNEIGVRSLFAHLTFGLLEGWWLVEDEALRIPGAPGLFPETWRKILGQEGFPTVVFPSPESHPLGQQVIVAESDGVICEEVQQAQPAATPPVVPVRTATENRGKSLRDACGDHLAVVVARVLRMRAVDIDRREALGAYGLDSILVTQITGALRENFPQLRSTLLFEAHTIEALSEALIHDHRADAFRLAGWSEDKAEATPTETPRRQEHRHAGACDEPIAIIGMSCRFPQADTAEAYWNLLEAGRSAIREIPAERWSLEGFYHPDPDEAVRLGKSYCNRGGFLEGVTEFDPLFFNIAPKEAGAIDPQERLFLQEAWRALEDAGYTPKRIAEDFGRQIGVFVGVTRTGFDLFGPPLWARGETLYPHTSFSSVANRLSFFLDARGPSVPVDTMCSSSLTAVHQACQSLRAGECRLALVGGVNVYLHPSSYVGLCATRMLSKDGVCRSFGKDADGFVPGEGVVALLLKPLSRAVADEDRIHAVIRATHVNHGGKTNGYTVPNPQAQAELVRDALLKAGVDARAVSYIEGHGTGTTLGDPIEVTGLTQAFRHFTADTGFCALGSAKSNIGHLEAAAGVAGLVKVVLQMQHGQIAPSLHAAEPNPNIDFAGTPFVVPQELAEWPRPRLLREGCQREHPRIAGVSSFGAGGANAHVLLEDYREPEPVAPEAGPCVIVLSARNAERLAAYATKLRDDISAREVVGEAPELADLAYTLQTGRAPMQERLAFIARSLAQVKERLEAYLRGEGEAAEIYAANVKQHKAIVEALADDETMARLVAKGLAENQLSRLASLWTKGLDIDWRALHAGRPASGRKPRLVRLPTYPFESTRYWLPEPVVAPPPPEAAPAIPPADDPADSRPIAGAQLPVVKLCDAAAFTLIRRPPAPLPNVTLSPLFAEPCAPTAPPAEKLVTDNLGNPIPSLRSEAGDREEITLKGAGAALPRTALSDVAVAGSVARGSPTASSEFKSLWAMRCREDIVAPGLNFGGLEVPAPLGSSRPVLRRAAVSVDAYANEVALVRLQERDGKNTSSPDFVKAVTEAFAHIAATPSYKAVVLTGFDTYFACGGTRDGLLAIQRGAARFTDEQTYSLPLLCEIPVIAAMQGHAIGAGWAMGLFCDYAVYSEESVYHSPYMLYGFTPGAGSTLIFPARLGFDLAGEVLFTAREYRGRDLQRRGLRAPVLPRGQVVDHALALASRLAALPRASLVAEKAARSEMLRRRLAEVFEQELALHDKTFVGNAAVVENIEKYFGSHGADETASGEAAPPARAVVDFTEARVWLRESLAEELGLAAEDLDQNTAFIDLGVDSISAVTWVRKLNRHFGLTLPATQVYRFPTLAQFATSLPGELRLREVETQDEALRAWLHESLARELLIPLNELDEDGKLVDLGLDSVTAVTWIRAINKHYGLSIAATRIYSHPTLADFCRFVQSLRPGTSIAPVAATTDPLATDAKAERTAAPNVAHSVPVPETPRVPAARPPAVVAPVAATRDLRARRTGNAIAILGMAGQFPNADNVQAFWRNLVEGRDCVSEIPASRWPVDFYHDRDRTAPGKTVCRRMGVLEGVDLFDPLFFNISPAEAEVMDPQQRLFLTNSWRCIEDAGYDPTQLSGYLCGVFVGCGVGDYGQLLMGQAATAQRLIGESVAMLPARVAYFLDLQGPCLAIDTACSSSLVALASACDSLTLGTSDLALAGGVYVLTGPDIHVEMSQAGMLSPDGRCYSFDHRANGFAPGEGVSVLLLKRLDDAERDGDDIHAVIRGWGVNQDGRTNGITAPNPDSQTRLETSVYDRFGIDPGEIGLVEAHGTGTALGDPIEVEALRAAFARFTGRKSFCALGSVKSNIGHLATAAGTTGVVKAVLALRARRLPPTINFEKLNEHIDLDGGPFYLNTQDRPWPAPPGGKRLAAVSSFGFSGTNAHVVLEERMPEPSADAGGEAPTIFPLSAQSSEQLRAYAQAVSDHLLAAPVALADLAHTFQTGRAVFDWRLAVVAGSVEELRDRLSRYAASGNTDPDCLAGRVVQKGAGLVAACLEATASMRERLRLAARAWVVGEAMEWASLGAHTGRRRHGLPTYPFALERYWVQPAEPDATASPGPVLVREPAVWRACPLPNADWSARLRQRLAQRVLILHTGDDLRFGFLDLLDKLQNVSAPDAERRLAVHPLGSPAGVFGPSAPDCILLLGGEDDDERIGAGLTALPSNFRDSEILLLEPSDRHGAARLGDRLTPLMRKGKVVTYDSGTGLDVAMQILFREWLAADPCTGLVQIHHCGVERLARGRTVDSSRSDPWLIRKDWEEKPARAAADPFRRGALLLLVNRESLPLARVLMRSRDFDTFVLAAPSSDAAAESDVVTFTDAVSVVSCGDVTHVLDLSDLQASSRDRDTADLERIALYQALIGTGRDLAVVHVTSGLQRFRAGRTSLAGAAFAGFVKMLGAEYPHVVARSIDIDNALHRAPERLRQVALREFQSEPGEVEVCYREGRRFVPTLSTAAAQGGGALRIERDGVYVVSGGTRGVGLEIARLLVRKGCRRLVLMGLSPLPPRARWRELARSACTEPTLREKLDALIELDAALDHFDVLTGHLSEPAPLRRFFDDIRRKLGPVRGIVHAAGAYSDPSEPAFVGKTPAAMQKVFEPKIEGLANLHAAVEADALDFFVCFASMAVLVPSLARGASDYAAASAYAAAFTAYQRCRNSRTLYATIVWPDWKETGALARLGKEKADAVEAAFHRIGLRTLSNAEGCALFELALEQKPDEGVVMIGCGDRRRFEEIMPRLLYADPFAEIHTPDARPAPKPSKPSISRLLDQWEAERRCGATIAVERVAEAMDLDEIRALDPQLVHRLHRVLFAEQAPVDLVRLITETVKEVLKLPSVDPARSFQSYGLDSISAMVLSTRLEAKLRRPVQSRWLIENCTVDALSRHLSSN